MKKPCRVWTRGKAGAGYGVWRFTPGRQEYVHRHTWEEAHGPIPRGMQVLHRCDNPPCYEVTHLFLGTQADNMRDKVRKGRQLRGARNPMALLEEHEVREIHALYARGLTLDEIAFQYGVTLHNVWRIVSGLSWRHLGLVTLGRQTRTKRRAAVARLRADQ